MKLYWIIGICLSPCFSFAQEKSIGDAFRADADSFWHSMPREAYNNPKGLYTRIVSVENVAEFASEEERRIADQQRIQNKVYEELYLRQLIEWGIAFWEKFPNDPRRFQWFFGRSLSTPSFFSNITEGAMRAQKKQYGVIALDTLAKQRWGRYYTRFRKEYMEFQPTKELIDLYGLEPHYFDKKTFQKLEIWGWLHTWQWRANENDKFDYEQYAYNAIDYAKKYQVQHLSPADFPASLLYKYPHRYGMSPADVEKFVSIIETSGLPAFNEFLHRYKNQIPILVKKYPLKFNVRTIAGKSLELRDLKGKLVLVDFWSLGCTSCIEKMPEVRKVYEKYKDHGFEVISACFITGKRDDGTEIYPGERNRILKVHERIGADWPLILLHKKDGEKRHRIWREYEFEGVPQLLLFNESGELIRYNGKMSESGGLEKVINEIIKPRNSQQNRGFILNGNITGLKHGANLYLILKEDTVAITTSNTGIKLSP